MPVPTLFTLKWAAEHKEYALYEQGKLVSLIEDDKQWRDWITNHASFAFQGKETRFNLLKEARKNKGEGYWYAYQRQGKRTIKRYAGRSADLTIKRLEVLASTIQTQQSHIPLLEPKLQPPRLHSGLVRRERLLSLLNTGTEGSLVLLLSPAGSGKTTLISQWLEEHQKDPPVTWLALDKNDNDPIRFWRYVITACQRFQADLGNSALEKLKKAPSFPPELRLFETVLTLFLNELGRAPHGGILVLEDYHVITSPSVHQSLSFFLEHLPVSINLTITTRNELPLSLTRLRARGELCEIMGSDLQFSQKEMIAFFQTLFPSQTSLEIALHIGTQLEGWAAGLRLCALSMQALPSEQTIQRLLTNFTLEYHPLHDYILEEVFSTLPEQLQTFLLQTCMLERLTPDLCNAVCEINNSASLLDSLERTGLFLDHLHGSGTWYRYHALFADTLRAEARRRFGMERLHTLLHKASTWYEQQGMHPEAIETALQGQDLIKAATLIEQHLAAHSHNEIQEPHTLRRWLEQLPHTIISSHPVLCFAYAQSISFCFVPGQPPPDALDQIEELLSIAEQQWQSTNDNTILSEIAAFHAYISMRRGDHAGVFAFANQALRGLPTTAKHWRGVCLALLGTRELQYSQLHQAHAHVQEALALWVELNHKHGARSATLTLGAIYHAQGALLAAEACYQRVIQEAREVGDNEDLIPALIAQARLAYEWNKLDIAEHIAQEAWSLGELSQSQETMAHASLVLILIWFAQERILLAKQRLSILITQLHLPISIMNEIRLHQIHFLLTEGNYMLANHHLQNLLTNTERLNTFTKERLTLLEVRLLLTQKKLREANILLEPIQLTASEAGHGMITLEVYLLKARIYGAEQHIDDACDALITALLIAHPEGHIRLFLDYSGELAEVMQATLPRIQDPTIASYLRSILRASDLESGALSQLPKSIEPLSRQEERVLRLLIAERSYAEIASELVVSINTIKTQVSSIYRKLNVHNRREARAAIQHPHL
ncbi:LuxR C-terminal-related transcriptional regulator [Ktedonospora formicarum]|uniref:Helix-turn-helix transcriptional regulator n=1 Tax=Ktedonospora formicarum TaxID=2778364 RepID=A0A8J3HZA9_9CHLR|nr:LuxR C-terminal-related transcriptional regulator [Ktedonospora formicarum]GHO46499.1 helix-turn-helix transcriptional regulator [Ktedonospora formicarum]